VAVSGKSFKVEVRKGTPLVPYVGDLENDKPLKIAPALENVGGDIIQSSREPGMYGTLAFTAKSITYEVKGRVNFQCSVSGAIASNNHVIAASDHGIPGDILFTQSNRQFGELSCFFPLREPSIHADFALGRLRVGAKTRFIEIRNIGVLRGDRMPYIAPH